MQAVWDAVPTLVPVHWNGAGEADTFQPATTLFWLSVMPAIGCGLVATAVLIFVGADTRRRTAALTHGALALIASAVSLQWVVNVLTALQADTGASNRIGVLFLLYLLALAWGGVVFLVTLLGAWARDPTNQSEPDDAATKLRECHDLAGGGKLI
jgi:uncharacterized protein DUF1648